MKSFLFSLLIIASVLGVEDLILNQSQYLGKVGDIRFSMLPPTIFEEENPGWVLMDGRKVDGSSYENLIGLDSIPNAINQFFRGMGGSYDAADGDILDGKSRQVGSVQEFSTARPKLEFSGNTGRHGAHQHSFKAGTVNKDPKDRKWQLGNLFQGKLHNWSTSTEGIHAHNFEVSIGGDMETRPTNLAFYVYIKID